LLAKKLVRFELSKEGGMELLETGCFPHFRSDHAGEDFGSLAHGPPSMQVRDFSLIYACVVLVHLPQTSLSTCPRPLNTVTIRN
jgi:hypothetical protein